MSDDSALAGVSPFHELLSYLQGLIGEVVVLGVGVFEVNGPALAKLYGLLGAGEQLEDGGVRFRTVEPAGRVVGEFVIAPDGFELVGTADVDGVPVMAWRSGGGRFHLAGVPVEAV